MPHDRMREQRPGRRSYFFDPSYEKTGVSLLAENITSTLSPPIFDLEKANFPE